MSDDEGKVFTGFLSVDLPGFGVISVPQRADGSVAKESEWVVEASIRAFDAQCEGRDCGSELEPEAPPSPQS